MFISTSFVRKVVATLGAAVGFVFVYETTIRDSRYSLRPASAAEATAQPTVGMSLNFTATAYCKGETTTSGVVVRSGVAAADPALLPVGSVVRVDAPDARYDGIYTIMDTGPAVQGRALDLYTWSCNEALKFGRRPVRVNVLRLGWNPQNSEPAAVDAMFQRREREKADTPVPAKVEPEPALTPTGSTTQPPLP
jgi:3D (Asp-Asp-Asp) domain-containing protein